MSNEIFKIIAQMNGVDLEESRVKLEALILEACKDPDATINFIPRKGKIPTVEEVFAFCLQFKD